MDGFDVDGKPLRKYFVGRTRAEVREKVNAWIAARESGLNTKDQYTFNKWSNIWFNNHKDNIKPVTQENYKYTLRILQDGFGPRLITEIKPYDVEQFLKKLRRDGRSDSAISQCRGMLYTYKIFQSSPSVLAMFWVGFGSRGFAVRNLSFSDLPINFERIE